MATIHLLGQHPSQGVAGRRIGSNSHSRSGSRAFVEYDSGWSGSTPAENELLEVCSGLFTYEGIVRGRGEGDASSDTLVIHVESGSRLLASTASESLHRILGFVLGSSPTIRFKVHGRGRSGAIPAASTKAGSVALFSGGTDSLSGLTVAQRFFGPAVAFHVSHSTSMANRIGLMRTEVLDRESIELQAIRVQPRSGPQQTRGLLYLAAAAVCARTVGTEHILVAESGPTMILPRISPLDEITVTTHPYLLQEVRRLAEGICRRRFTVHLPFMNLTKAESLAACGLKYAIPVTNSCITSMWANAPVSHCGLCFGCLVRRLSASVAGVKDARYLWDPVLNSPSRAGHSWATGRRVSPEKFAEFQRLLLFCREVLNGRLSTTTSDDLKFLSREDLIRRFALDMIAGAHVLLNGHSGTSGPWTMRFLDECRQDGVIRTSQLKERISEVRSISRQPNVDWLL